MLDIGRVGAEAELQAQQAHFSLTAASCQAKHPTRHSELEL